MASIPNGDCCFPVNLPGQTAPVSVAFGLTEDHPSYPILAHWFFDDQKVGKFGSLGEDLADPYRAGSSSLLVLSRLPAANRGLRLLFSGSTG